MADGTELIADMPVTDGYALVEIFNGTEREFVFAVRCGVDQASQIAAEQAKRHQGEFKRPLTHRVRTLATYRPA